MYFLEASTHAETISPLADIECGVPQGSILGPLLFIIYINDLNENVSKSHAIHYADDTTLFSASSENESQADIDNTLVWLCDNKLTLHTKQNKCQLLSFGKTPPQRICIDGIPIKCSDCSKYVGLYIDKRLNFKEHIKFVMSKISKLIGLTFRLRHFLSTETLVRFYNVYIKPRIQYGILIYGCANKTDLNKIKILQNKFLRAISFKRSTESVDSLYIKYKILDIFNLHIYDLLKFVLRSINCPNSPVFNDYFKIKQPTKNTRAATKVWLNTGAIKNKMDKKSLKYRGAKLFNALSNIKLLPSTTLDEKSIQKFVHEFKDSYLLFDNQLKHTVF